MGSKVTAISYISMILLLISLPPIHACASGCSQPGHDHPKVPRYGSPSPPVYPPIIVRPPPRSGGGGGGGIIVIPPPPPGSRGGGGGAGGGGGGGGVPSPPPPGVLRTPPPPPASRTCPIDALKLGLCLDVLSGLIHVGIGNPAENICCPVIQGLLEVEAAICLCTTLRLRLLNLNIFIPIALQVLITCGLNPPPNFVCPPLS